MKLREVTDDEMLPLVWSIARQQLEKGKKIGFSGYFKKLSSGPPIIGKVAGIGTYKISMYVFGDRNKVTFTEYFIDFDNDDTNLTIRPSIPGPRQPNVDFMIVNTE